MAGHDITSVISSTLHTCENGFFAAIKGLLGAVGLSEPAPAVCTLPWPGFSFRPAELDDVSMLPAFFSTPLDSCCTQTFIRQTYACRFKHVGNGGCQADLHVLPQ